MMTYDGLVLASVTAELRRYIQGGPIQGIRQHNDTDLTFEIRNAGRTYLLFMSVHARFSRIYTTATNLPVPPTPLNFCMLLRKYLKGSYIVGVGQAGFDRVIKLKTEAPDGNRNVLVLELMGKHSNLILLSDTGRILGAAKNVPASVSRYRQILPGRDYIPPPGGGKANPLDVTPEELRALWRDGIGQQEATPEVIKHWLVAAFSGIGPFLAEELMTRAEQPTVEAVESALNDLREIVVNCDYAPVLITDDRGAAIYAYPIPVSQFPISNQHERHSMNEVLDTLYRDLIHRSELDTEYSGLETAIKRSIAWREQTARDLEKAISEGNNAERYKQFGELLMASAGSIVKGQTAARVIDYYNPEMHEIEIPLDEKMNPRENAERYFKKYRKAVEGAETAVDRLSELQTEITILKSAWENLPNATSVEDIKDLQKMLSEKGLLRAELKPPVRKKEEPEFAGAKIRRLTSRDGFEILYGENSQSNDYLTTKVAKPNDLWFHARSVTGAHVVVRSANKPDNVPQRTIMQAAEIAARNSDAKHSSLVAVDYTLKKYVRKPRSSAPGFVTYGHEKTVDVTPELL